MNSKTNADLRSREPEQSGNTDAKARSVVRPPVDIFEDEHGITLQADLPGVSRDALEIHVDRDSLSIEADARIELPEDIRALHADVRATHYQRSFTLSSELDAAGIEANLTDGVLTLSIPKRDEVRPRRIEIRS